MFSFLNLYMGINLPGAGNFIIMLIVLLFLMKHKCYLNGAALMDDELRKKLLTEWQNKKKETITHPFLNEKVEWGMVPHVQAMFLARYLRGDLESYPVFLWK